MKAIEYTKYGPPDVLQQIEVEDKTPNDNEALIKVLAVSLNPLDYRFLRGKPYLIRIMTGLLKPENKILGTDLAGIVESVGRKVKQFKPGDEVFGGIPLGGLAEYVCVCEDRLVMKPAGTTFEEAAAVPVAALSALQGLRLRGQIQPGQKVLIYGASGGVGTFAVQIAKSFGAEVTGVCSTRNLDMVRSIGADQVIDYTKEDFTKNGQRYDRILAIAGNHSILAYKRALSPGGTCVLIGGSSMPRFFTAMLLGPLITSIGKRKICNMVTGVNKKDLLFLKELLESGKITSVIDRRYTFSDVPEALRYLEKGHARGKVVITVEHNSKT